MKILKICLFLCFLTVLTVQAQNILRVNNIPTVNTPYNTIDAAVAAAGPNDIILVEGSPFVYDGGGITISKKVTLVGTGYFLDPSVQVNPYDSRIGPITLNPGSDGSTITGFDVGANSITIKSPNVIFSNNYVGGSLTFTDVSNVTIKENYLSSIVRGFTGTTAVLTNILISNNYVDNLINVLNGTGGLTYGVVTNNIIAKTNTGTCSLDNCQVTNNIFLSQYNPTVANPVSSFTNTSFSNNLFVAPSQTGSTATDIFNVSATSLFVGLAGNNTDTQWKLKAGSPAIGAGASGVDCGMYGGANPYKPYGLRVGQPTLTGFSAPGTVPINGTLNVKVSAKVN